MVRRVDGRGFAFVPREMVAQPKAFGVVQGLIDPAEGVDRRDDRYRAAMLQHVLVGSVRARLIASKGLTPAQYVRDNAMRGLSEDRVRRIFRGETMSQLTDVVFWVSRFPEVAIDIANYILEVPREDADEVVADGAVDPLVAGSRTEGLAQRVATRIPSGSSADVPPVGKADGGDMGAEEQADSSERLALRERRRATWSGRRGRPSPQHPFG